MGLVAQKQSLHLQSSWAKAAGMRLSSPTKLMGSALLLRLPRVTELHLHHLWEDHLDTMGVLLQP